MIDVPKSPDLEKQIVGLRNSMNFQARKSFISSASHLYDQLFPKGISSRVQKLIIIPDGKLGTIPFEVLINKKNIPENEDYRQLPYLLRQTQISYHYSGTLYQQIFQAAPLGGSKSQNIFLCAPVIFPRQNLSALPGTETEVNQIHRLFSEQDFEAHRYLRHEAGEQVVKSEKLKDYQYIHFATHGLVNEASPELSRIFLAPDTLQGEDGSLYVGEIYNLQLSAALVAVSACETGLGKLSQGEGIMGLSRALIYAGAENLLVSLWKVSDQSTSQLLVNFYEQTLRQHHSPAYGAALRQAKLNLLESPQYAQPYYWAPFILIGR
ncbi:MAG: CHAT domain-containing protein [Bacteroidia bacterium]|nr:CHAT domain-containing protein [Bacteroidia bacterium]